MAADTVAKVSASVIDAEGIKASVLSHLFIDSAQTVAQIKTAVGSWAHTVDQVSGAKMEALRFELQLQDVLAAQNALFNADPGTGVKVSPAADSEVQEVGIFDFNQAGVPYRYGQGVPALIEALTALGPVNIGDAKVAALVTLLTSAALGGHYTGMSTAALTALSRAFRGDRKRRKQLFSKSVANV